MATRECAGLGLLFATGVGGTALVLGCWRGRPDGDPATAITTDGRASQGEAPPIPKAGPLARPRPLQLQQFGLSTELTRPAVPADNQQSPEKIALGEKLFFDRRLCADDTVACAACHDPTRAFTDGRPISIGIHGRAGQRNAPTVLITISSASLSLRPTPAA